MEEQDIQIMLRDNLPDAKVIVSSADGTHFEAVVVTDAFLNQKPLARQRIVYAIVGSHITSGAIHALSLKTYTHQEWKEKCSN
jgi:acid stress-induced BolA-like protein IbaG/YrbA